MRWVLSLILAFPLTLFAADGDIVSASVETNGWILDVWIAGNSGSYTNGTFAFGFGTDNALTGTEKLRMTVTSPGYNGDGTTNQTTRMVYGTYQVRFPYPNQAFSDSTIDGSNIKIKVSLSSFIYVGDISLTADFGSGLYATNTITSASATGLTVTNTSTQPYPTTIGNWTMPGLQRVSSSPFKLRAVAFHGSATNGCPVRAVTFTAADAHSHTATTTVTNMSIDFSMGDAKPFGEYIGSMNVSGFTQGDTITCNFTAFPWIGDTNSVLNTATTGLSLPNPSPLSFLCDISGTYGTTRAIVDSSTGVDANGIAANEVYWATNQSPTTFLTIGGALKAIGGTNNTFYSHADPGGGIVYLNAGNHTWLGSSVTIATPAPVVEVLVTPAPGVTRAQAIITDYSTDRNVSTASDIYHLYDLTLNGGSAAPFAFIKQLWLDHCDVTWTSAAFVQGTALLNWYTTECNVGNIVQGLNVRAGEYATPTLVRGNTLNGFGKNICIYTCVGNKKLGNLDAGTNIVLLSSVASQTATIRTHPILYNNEFLTIGAPSAAIMTIGASHVLSNGIAIVQNVVEHHSTSTATSNLGSTDGLNTTNMMYWHNVLLGHRDLYGYNWSGTGAFYRYLWSSYNNVGDAHNSKDDTTAAPDATRVGNWPIMWGVNHRGDNWLQTTGTGVSGVGPYFPGIYAWDGPSSTTNYPAWVNRQAYDGVNVMPGNGNYRLQTKSPLITRVPTRWVIPFDIEGVYRGLSDPPGAYASAGPRKAAGFFAP